MRQGSSAYSYGNLAYKVEDRRVEKRVVVKRRAVVKKDVVCRRLSLLGGAVAVFAMVIILMSGYSNLEYKQSMKNAKIKELKLIQDELYNTKVEIAETIDMENVEKVAKNKLGMVKPADYQIVYVSVPKENYTIKY